jgi:hypothetical protein
MRLWKKDKNGGCLEIGLDPIFFMEGHNNLCLPIETAQRHENYRVLSYIVELTTNSWIYVDGEQR